MQLLKIGFIFQKPIIIAAYHWKGLEDQIFLSEKSTRVSTQSRGDISRFSVLYFKERRV
jgi:hypothetical protein